MPLPTQDSDTQALGTTETFPDDARVFVHAPAAGGGGSEGGGLASIADLRTTFQQGVATLISDAIAAAVAALKWKTSVACATTANITLSGEQTIDGILTAASRVLVKNQTAPAENGIYVSAAGAWTRATDADSSAELANATVPVEAGTVNADLVFVCTTNTPITVDTTALTFLNLASGLTGVLLAANNLSDVANGTTALQNLGGAAPVGTGAVVRKTSPEINTTAAGYVKVADPASDVDGAVPKWVMLANILSSINALPWKAKVVVATTVAGTLATSFENGDTIDGVVLATGDRILIKDQAAPAENGIYEVQASGAPTRTTDADSGAELVNAIVPVEKGTANTDKVFVCTTNGPITVGATALVWVNLLSALGATAAAQTVLDDSTVSAMVDTLGGAAAQGSGGLVREDSPTLTTPVLADASTTGSLLMTGSSGAFRPPRLTTAERNALAASAGLVIFNTTTNKLNVYGASAWEAVTSV